MESKKLFVYTDGASRGNPGMSSVAFLVYDSKHLLHREAKPIGIATNNEAEYRAVIEALGLVAYRYRHSEVIVHSDSELMVKQLTGQWRIKESRLQGMYDRVKAIEPGMSSVKYVHLRRTHPMMKKADMLANWALDTVKR